MNCHHCGNPLNQGASFCEKCGAPVENQQAPSSKQNTESAKQVRLPNQSSLPEQPQKQKKAWYKRWWIWLLIGLGTFFLLINTTCTCLLCIGLGTSSEAENSIVSEIKNPSNSDDTKEAETSNEPTSEASTTVSEADAERENKENEEKKNQEDKGDFINSCETIDYKTLSRNPDKYKGDKYKFTGQVIQVLDSDSLFDNSTTLRINVTPEENEFAEGGYLWSDTILATVVIPDGADRILEDDIVDIYGTCEGLYTYETVLGDKKSLPLIDIRYYEIHD